MFFFFGALPIDKCRICIVYFVLFEQNTFFNICLCIKVEYFGMVMFLYSQNKYSMNWSNVHEIWVGLSIVLIKNQPLTKRLCL